MCAFHVKSPEIVTPKSLASLTNLMHSSPMTTGGKSQSDVKLMRRSLHLSVFNLTLFLITTTTANIIENWKITNYITLPPANGLYTIGKISLYEFNGHLSILLTNFYWWLWISSGTYW